MDLNFPKIEEKILRFWRKDDTFKKSVKQRKDARRFVFFEGPPTANGRAGIHHILARIFKDVICRYKAMQGFKVERKAGWDTHGLPVELEVEKRLGLKSKKEIEKYGIAKFNKQCRKSVWLYQQDWEKITERIGFWVDMENPYITYKNGYIESVWSILKKISEKNLVYQDYKSVPYCPRCGTVLSSHEVALGYKKVKDPAVYVKFRLEDEESTSLLVWTTTPWTLPGNTGIAVNPDFVYVKAKFGDEKLILLKEKIHILGNEVEASEEIKGKDLVGLKYLPFYPSEKAVSQGSNYKVIAGSFVSLEDGTGLVHIAPAFGEEDLEVGKKNNLLVLKTVDEAGRMTTPGYAWDNLFVKEADPMVTEDLETKGLLFKKEDYEHDYPFCWRCGSPLLYYAKQSWFINMQKVKKQLILNNERINWVPSHLKEGRVGEWLREVKDWAFSRERYWGTPLPVWECDKCKKKIFIGGMAELSSQKASKNNFYFIRHGESLRQKRRISACFPEKLRCPLTPKGRKQVEEQAKKLKAKKIDLIFSSDLLRTKETAEIISKEIKVKPAYDKRLREYNAGIFNGKSVDLIHSYFKNDLDLRFKKRIPKGESYTDLQRRMHQFLKEINEKYEGKNILVVSHETPLTLLEAALKGIPKKEFFAFREKNKLEVSEFKKVEFRNFPYDLDMEIDLHRPYVDEIEFYCSCQKGKMKRVKEVIDCWFDSGSMPFAQAHWPFDQKDGSKKPPALFPADYISEAVDQTRGWFYTLHAISTLLNFGPAYKNVISVGHILDKKGEKMSKSKGNVVNPWQMISIYGADAVRWYLFTLNQPGDSKLFSEKDLSESLRRFAMTFWNCAKFFETYRAEASKSPKNVKNLLDKWILSRLSFVERSVGKMMGEYDVTSAARLIENFVIEDLSLWYIRRSRRRFQKPETKEELQEAAFVLEAVLKEVSLILAPFVPFLSEKVYSMAGGRKSVHLEDWPKNIGKREDKKLDESMNLVREVVKLGLKIRASSGLKLRQPLSELRFRIKGTVLGKGLEGLIKEELNVKKIKSAKTMPSGRFWKKEESGKINAALNVEMTQELKEEGEVKEILRFAQEMRKEGGLKPKDRIEIYYSGNFEISNIIKRNKDIILKETKAQGLFEGKKPGMGYNIEKEVKVDSRTIWLGIKKVK